MSNETVSQASGLNYVLRILFGWFPIHGREWIGRGSEKIPGAGLGLNPSLLGRDLCKNEL